jgi:hypothetical protein
MLMTRFAVLTGVVIGGAIAGALAAACRLGVAYFAMGLITGANKSPTDQAIVPPRKVEPIPGIPEPPGAIDPRQGICMAAPRPIIWIKSEDGTAEKVIRQVVRGERPPTGRDPTGQTG